MRQQTFPSGWDEERVQKVRTYYEEQTEDEAVAEDEAAFAESTQTMMEVPHELVPTTRELIAKHQASRHRKGSPSRLHLLGNLITKNSMTLTPARHT